MIILKGNPKSTQTIYRSCCRGGFPTVYMDKTGKEIKARYIQEVKDQWKEEIITGDVFLEIDFYFGDKRIRDIDNFNKLVLDALTKIVYEDDKQIQELLLRKHYDKENPRVEILIK